MEVKICRTGDIRIHGTSLNVWEENVDQDGMRIAMRSLLGRMTTRGFSAQMDPEAVERYPSIAPDYWLVRKGELRATVTLSGRHLSLEFFQDLNVSNPNGGRYDFDKYLRMPRPMRLQCIVEMRAVIGKLYELGYVYRGKDQIALAAPTPLQVRDFMDPPNRWGTLANFNEGWNFEGDWARGGRFERDETGWPTWKQIGQHRDRDGVPILNGETRYLYHRGNLMRGIVRPNMNGMWSVGDFTYVGSGHLFFCDPTTVPRRLVPGQPKRLRAELEKALEARDYGRVKALAGALGAMETRDAA